MTVYILSMGDGTGQNDFCYQIIGAFSSMEKATAVMCRMLVDDNCHIKDSNIEPEIGMYTFYADNGIWCIERTTIDEDY